ncbi:MAG: TatD family hydrolase [Limnobacter sp.]|nr:TatD family hydrolase [Limnobacter sp.]
MWTDTHLHLDADQYSNDRNEVLARARSNHVNAFVLPAVHPRNFGTVQNLARQTPGAVYCLGIHPVFVHACTDSDLQVLKTAVAQALADPLFAGIGEIGLDAFVPNPDLPRQTTFFYAQLELAAEFNLPVVMHIRKAQDHILKGLRRYRPCSGIAHAFNGSLQQADQFLKLNMCLGFGGASTFSRAHQIRRLAALLPAQALVLETDGPDIAPEWINHQRNEPCHLHRIAENLASLRGIGLSELSAITQANAHRVLPALVNRHHSLG